MTCVLDPPRILCFESEQYLLFDTRIMFLAMPRFVQCIRFGEMFIKLISEFFYRVK